MEQPDSVPLVCPKCHCPTEKPVRWVQENTFFTCAACGASSLIDKDEASKTLAAMTRERQ
jgi:hypothetical protein